MRKQIQRIEKKFPWSKRTIKRTEKLIKARDLHLLLMKDPNNQGVGVNNIFMTQLENICIIDSGCPKSVMSQMWTDTYKASLMNNEKLQGFHFREKKEYKLFKFGPSQVYTSTRSMMIPIVLGNEVKEVEVSIIHANIPFLLGRDYLN